jgi:hypothetical protein
VIWCKAKLKDIAALLFREYGKCIFVGKCTRQKQAGDNQAESSGGKHVTRARGWWKRGDVAACAAQTNMHCWVHQDALFNDEKVKTNVREAWEHEGSKDELNIVLHVSVKACERVSVCVCVCVHRDKERERASETERDGGVYLRQHGRQEEERHCVKDPLRPGMVEAGLLLRISFIHVAALGNSCSHQLRPARRDRAKD